MKMSSIAIDPTKREQGAWVSDIPELPGVRLKVRGSECAEARRLRSALIEQLPRQKRIRARLDAEDQDQITGAVLHRVLLLDWDGIEDDQDQPVPYSKEQALEYLTDPRFSVFRSGALWAANVVAEDQDAAKVDDVGNSSKSSAGSSSGATRKAS